MVIGGGSIPVDDQCPSCDRTLEYMTDFPILQILSVDDIVTADKVPDDVLGRSEECLEKKGWIESVLGLYVSSPIVPPEVVRYLKGNLSGEKVMTSGDYAYFTQDRSRSDWTWWRRYNYTPTVRTMLQDDGAIAKYLQSLQDRSGQDIPTKEIFPHWSGHYDNGQLLFNSPGRTGPPFLYVSSAPHNRSAPSTVSLHLATGVTRQGDVETILRLATLKYASKLRAPAAPSAPPLAAVG